MKIIRTKLRKYIERLPWLFSKFRPIQKIFESEDTFVKVSDITEGLKGKDGKDGEDGHTPYIVDGNWWINGVDTGFPSTGEDGKGGEDGKDGQDGITTNLNPESPNTTLRMWEGTRNQYDSQEPLDDDIITFIREL